LDWACKVPDLKGITGQLRCSFSHISAMAEIEIGFKTEQATLRL